MHECNVDASHHFSAHLAMLTDRYSKIECCCPCPICCACSTQTTRLSMSVYLEGLLVCKVRLQTFFGSMVQCFGAHLKSRHRTTLSLSSRSSSGSAYLLRLAVKTTTSKRSPTSAMNRSMKGRFKTYTSTTLSSISTGMMKSGLGTGLKEECTSVSSRSRTRHFLCLSCGAAGPMTGSPAHMYIDQLAVLHTYHRPGTLPIAI